MTNPSTTLTQEELEQLRILMDPVLWAQVYIGWQPRDYQINILRSAAHHKLNVFRLGRRLGKTEMLCILILWHAFCQPNKKPQITATDDQYNILIVTPGEEQIKLIFDRLHQLISASPVLQSVITRDIENRIEFSNGTIIKGMTAGSRSNSGAANTRGQRADLLVMDRGSKFGYVVWELWWLYGRHQGKALRYDAWRRMAFGYSAEAKAS